MAFEGRTLREASQLFKEHLNQLLSHTITRTPLIAMTERHSDLASIGFRQGGMPGSALLHTRFGMMNLYLGQVCDAEEADHSRVRLRIVKYQYKLTPAGVDEPVIRWEYDRFPTGQGLWCRHHVQGPMPLSLGPGRPISLNDLHLPTGPIPIEEVVRFCIVDLGVRPLDPSIHDDGLPAWHHRLIESQTQTWYPDR